MSLPLHLFYFRRDLALNLIKVTFSSLFVSFWEKTLLNPVSYSYAAVCFRLVTLCQNHNTLLAQTSVFFLFQFLELHELCLKKFEMLHDLEKHFTSIFCF